MMFDVVDLVEMGDNRAPEDALEDLRQRIIELGDDMGQMARRIDNAYNDVTAMPEDTMMWDLRCALRAGCVLVAQLEDAIAKYQ
jgi:hypothetical protein